MCRRTVSQASRKGHGTSSHNGSIRSDTTRSQAIAALLPQSLEPTLILTFFNALSSAAIGSLRCSSRNSKSRFYFFSKCPLREPDHKILPSCLWLLSWPTKLLPSGPPVGVIHFLPNLLLRCLCATPGRRHARQHQPGDGSIFSAQCG